MDELIQIVLDICWTPIQKMTAEQVAELLQQANHPGKDRIPREAAMSGCIVIARKRWATAYYEDVPTPEQYKLSEENSCEDVI